MPMIVFTLPHKTYGMIYVRSFYKTKARMVVAVIVILQFMNVGLFITSLK